MKKMKKLIAVLLTTVMALAMSVTAFAAGEGDSDGSKTESKTYEYEIYQIFTGTYKKDVLSDVRWGENGTGTKGELVTSDILEALEEVENASDSEKLAVIKRYAVLDPEKAYNAGQPTITTTEGSTTTYTYSGLPDGYYLIKDVDDSITGNDVYTTYVAWVTGGTLTFTRKGNVPDVEKKIVETTKDADNNDVTEYLDETTASIGDIINYQITGTLPTNLADYNTYYYAFTDTLSKGLTYTANSVKVTVDGVDLTKYFYVNAAKNSNEETVITVAIPDLLALNYQDETHHAVANITHDSQIVISYSAKLNESAVIAGEGNKNAVKLTYSNNPNDSGDGTTAPPPENPDKPEPKHPTGETPEDEVVVYTTELTILKVNESDQVLQGAEFTLTGDGVNIVLVKSETFTEDENGEYWKLKNGTYTTEAPTETEYDGNDIIVAGNEDDYNSTTKKYTKGITTEVKTKDGTGVNVVGTIDEGGHVTFSGLGAGKYTLKETKTPDGYNTIKDIEFTIDWEVGSKSFVIAENVDDNQNNNVDITSDGDNIFSIKIVNYAGSLLPSTGGTGTTILYILGAILVVGAGILLVVRRRMRADM